VALNNSKTGLATIIWRKYDLKKPEPLHRFYPGPPGLKAVDLSTTLICLMVRRCPN